VSSKKLLTLKKSVCELNVLEKGRHIRVMMIVTHATMFGNTLDNVEITRETHGDRVLLTLFIANPKPLKFYSILIRIQALGNLLL